MPSLQGNDRACYPDEQGKTLVQHRAVCVGVSQKGDPGTARNLSICSSLGSKQRHPQPLQIFLSSWPSPACCLPCLSYSSRGRSFSDVVAFSAKGKDNVSMTMEHTGMDSPGYAGRLPGLLPLLRGPARGAPPGGMAGLVRLQRGPHLLALRQESRTALRGQAGASATPWCLGRAIPSVRGVCAKKSHRKHHMEPFGIPRTPVLSRDVVEIECWAQVRPNRPSLPRL